MLALRVEAWSDIKTPKPVQKTATDEVTGSPSELREEPMKMAYVQSTLRRHTGAWHLPTTKGVVSLDKEGGLELWHPKEQFSFQRNQKPVSVFLFGFPGTPEDGIRIISKC